MSPHRFVVRRQVYTPPDAAGVRRLLPEKHDRVATFTKADAAFADCDKRLAEFRRTANPFQLGGPCLFYQTNLPAFAFHDYLLDHNVAPPPTSLTANPNYVFWWVKNNRTFTDREREVVWRACDKLKPFDVIEEDDRKAVYVVVETVWFSTVEEWGDDDLHTSLEGGHAVGAFREIRKARRACEARASAKREEFRDFDFLFVRGSREVVETVFDSAADTPFAEVVAVPWVGENSATGFLLARQTYRSAAGGYDYRWGRTRYGPNAARIATINLGSRVLILAAADRGKGQELLAQAIETARRTVNPFALASPERFSLEVLVDETNSYLLDFPNGLTLDDAIEIVRKLPTIPPAPEVLTADWYDRVVQWSPEFVDVIWSTFADFRLFEVVEVPLGN